jgi:hypothetical protein
MVKQKKINKEIAQFIRVQTKNAVIIIPLKYYLMGIDFENFGIATSFIEEDDRIFKYKLNKNCELLFNGKKIK